MRKESTLHGTKSNQSDWLDFKQVITGVERHRLEADPPGGHQKKPNPDRGVVWEDPKHSSTFIPQLFPEPPYSATLFLIF